MREIVGTLQTHAHDGGHVITAYVERYGRGDWREGVTGSLWSAERGDSASAPNKAEAMRRARLRLRDMAEAGERAANGIAARQYLKGSPGHEMFDAIAAHYAVAAQ
jgi:hypothetical protein